MGTVGESAEAPAHELHSIYSKFESGACHKPIGVEAIKGVQELEQKALKVDFEQLILLLEGHHSS